MKLLKFMILKFKFKLRLYLINDLFGLKEDRVIVQNGIIIIMNSIMNKLIMIIFEMKLFFV